MIWLIGCKGMLGKDVAQRLAMHKLPYWGTDSEVDITDGKALARFIAGKDISWIINCAAYTAVDKAETDSERAYAINATGAGNIAHVARQLAAKLIHFSTDYVFSGKGQNSYRETDAVDPQSNYGKSKCAGEKFVISLKKYYLFRISWLYGLHGPNFVATMLRLFREKEELRIVGDQIGSPTYTVQLAENIVTLIQNDRDAFGIYHYSDAGFISWFEYACQIKALAQELAMPIKDVRLHKIATQDYPTPAIRPQNSRMDTSKVQKLLEFKIVNWQENLTRFFEELT